MLLDSEPEQKQSCQGDKHCSEDIGYNDNHLKRETLKNNNEVDKGGSDSFTSSEQVAYVDVGDSSSANQNNGGHKIAPYYFSLPHFEKFGNEIEFSMDKAVTEIEPSKMNVCYKEGSYHIIKDVHIDKGTHSFDKFLFENGTEEERIYSISQIDRDKYTDELYISSALKSSRLIRQPFFDVNKDMKQCSLGNSLEECQGTHDMLDETSSNEVNERRFSERVSPLQGSDTYQFQGCTNDIQNEKLKKRSLASLLEEDRVKPDIAGETAVHASETGGMLIERELDIQHCHFALSNLGSNLDQAQLIKDDTDQPQSINGDCEQPQCIKVESHKAPCATCDCIKLPSAVGNTDQLHSVCDGINEKQPHKCALEETKSAALYMSSEEPKEGNSAKKLLVTGKSGSGIIEFDINSELQDSNPKKDIEGVSDFQQSGLTTRGPTREDASTDGLGASPQYPLNSPGHSDSNPPGPVSLSGRISYVDQSQTPYSGSISLRSDGSATSTHSFAFPILQSEWKGSPVRMARADHGHLKKHGFWVSRLFCCIF